MPRPFTPQTLAERWGCSERHVRALCNAGEIKSFRVGKLLRIPADEVERLGPVAPVLPKRTALPVELIPDAQGRVPDVAPWMWDTERSEPTHTYLIRCTVTGLVKIGIASDVARRLNNLQLMCPTKLELVWMTTGGRDLEKALHQRFASKRRHGEWFALSDEEIEECASAC